MIDPDLWRRPERNRAGDTFTCEVYRSTVAKVAFDAETESLVRTRLAQNLTNAPHTVRLANPGPAAVTIEFLEAFAPPLK